MEPQVEVAGAVLTLSQYPSTVVRAYLDRLLRHNLSCVEPHISACEYVLMARGDGLELLPAEWRKN